MIVPKKMKRMSTVPLGRRMEKAVSKFISWRRRKYLCLSSLILGFFVATVWTFLAMAQNRQVEPTTVAVPSTAELKRLNQRPIQFPNVPAGEPCPVSKGSRETVPHVGYIFRSDSFFFGHGPTYFALLFLTDPTQNIAVVNLDKVFYRQGGVFSMKTPWVTRPDYSGPVLVRGRRLDGEGRLEGPALEAPRRGHETDWSFWPDEISVTGQGCYGIQIDTDQGTDVVVFKATGGDTQNRPGTEQ